MANPDINMMNTFNLLKESSEKVLKDKATEYASDKSRYHNFEVAADLTDETPEKALIGMMLKHVVSVQDIINNASYIKTDYFIEKFGDTYNYCLLLMGMLKGDADPTKFNELIGKCVEIDPDKHPEWTHDSIKSRFIVMNHVVNDKYIHMIDKINVITRFVVTLIKLGSKLNLI